MKLLVAIVVIVLLITFDQSTCSVDSMWDSVKGAAGDVGEFFQNRFTDFKSLFANNDDVILVVVTISCCLFSGVEQEYTTCQTTPHNNQVESESTRINCE
jgi:hypothetical protein